jgi:hypothetical protein
LLPPSWQRALERAGSGEPAQPMGGIRWNSGLLMAEIQRQRNYPACRSAQLSMKNPLCRLAPRARQGIERPWS